MVYLLLGSRVLGSSLKFLILCKIVRFSECKNNCLQLTNVVAFQVIINIEDINDNLAKFDDLSLNLTLPEHLANGLDVIKMKASDRDKVTGRAFQL